MLPLVKRLRVEDHDRSEPCAPRHPLEGCLQVLETRRRILDETVAEEVDDAGGHEPASPTRPTVLAASKTLPTMNTSSVSGTA